MADATVGCLFKYYVTFSTFMIIQMLSGVNDFDVCCKIGCLCKYYVTFFTFSIIQKLCCEWHWCVLQDRMHLQILCNIFHIHDYSKALLWAVSIWKFVILKFPKANFFNLALWRLKMAEIWRKHASRLGETMKWGDMSHAREKWWN